MEELGYCVYILFSEKDHLLYTGYNSNIKRRYQQHMSGQTVSTKYRGPWKLIFVEYYLFKEDAMNLETYLKTSMGKRALKFMLNGTFEKLGYKGKMMCFID